MKTSSLAFETRFSLYSLTVNLQLSNIQKLTQRATQSTLDAIGLIKNVRGELLTTSACQQAALAAQCGPVLLKRLAFSGILHHGAPVERIKRLTARGSATA